MGHATYSLFWLFLLLPLRIFIPVWYIISASCICRLLAASSSAENKTSVAFTWIILHQLLVRHQNAFLLLGGHANKIHDCSPFQNLTLKIHGCKYGLYLTKDRTQGNKTCWNHFPSEKALSVCFWRYFSASNSNFVFNLTKISQGAYDYICQGQLKPGQQNTVRKILLLSKNTSASPEMLYIFTRKKYLTNYAKKINKKFWFLLNIDPNLMFVYFPLYININTTLKITELS